MENIENIKLRENSTIKRGITNNKSRSYSNSFSSR